MKNQISWEELVAQFEQVEQQLSENTQAFELNNFFTTVQQYFTDNNFEKWQLTEVSERTAKIMAVLERIKQELYERSSNLEKSKSQLNSYVKNSYLAKDKD